MTTFVLDTLATVEKSKGGRGVKTEMSVSAFAKRLGKSQPYITQVVKAAEVYKLISQLMGFSGTGRVQHLFEIHAAPEPTWATLAALLVEQDWSVKDTKAAVERINAVQEAIPDWWPFPLDAEYPRTRQ